MSLNFIGVKVRVTSTVIFVFDKVECSKTFSVTHTRYKFLFYEIKFVGILYP